MAGQGGDGGVLLGAQAPGLHALLDRGLDPAEADRRVAGRPVRHLRTAWDTHHASSGLTHVVLELGNRTGGRAPGVRETGARKLLHLQVTRCVRPSVVPTYPGPWSCGKPVHSSAGTGVAYRGARGSTVAVTSARSCWVTVVRAPSARSDAMAPPGISSAVSSVDGSPIAVHRYGDEITCPSTTTPSEVSSK
ncbi:Uncharacterised protein [Mycobacteroides abscessus]|nr:Uncharacterised protein [Mycobacteroides abscessus]